MNEVRGLLGRRVGDECTWEVVAYYRFPVLRRPVRVGAVFCLRDVFCRKRWKANVSSGDYSC